MAIITSNSITIVDNTGIEKYLYIRYSNDGETFTDDNGLTPGSWLGTCTVNSSTAPTNFSTYTWTKIEGLSSYFHIKYSNDGETFTDNNGENVGDWIGTCTTNTKEDPTDFDSYTWRKIAGNGIVRITEFYLLSDKKEGITRQNSEWTTNIQSLSKEKKYLWNYEVTEFTNGDIDESEPMIIGVYGDGIQSIVNYYAVTASMEDNILDEDWNEGAPPGLSSVNKYLWNYEKLTYTDGTSSTTTPAIIGIYGDSGENAITFEIYSQQGFMFKNNLEEITLQIAAFEGSQQISGAEFTWEWWSEAEAAYKNILANILTNNIVIKESDIYAYANLRCTMSYNGKLYYDYVTLTNETVVYTAVVKFPDGNNVFHADDSYLIAYVDLYQNNNKVDGISGSQYWSGIATESNGIITANVNEGLTNGETMYFVCSTGNGPYEVKLGRYNSSSKKWEVVNNNTGYNYTNTLYPNIESNIIAISKEDINKSAMITFYVSKNGVELAEAHANVIDSNDPIISSTEPANPVNGQLWLNTKNTPPTLEVWNDGAWTKCAEQPGGAVFTSQPTSYAIGDLWILAKGETCGEFKVGSMLKATQTATSITLIQSHWIDADEETTTWKKNVEQYMRFDAGSGLKIGQVDEKFYVQIDSTEMGFYDNTDNKKQKVVAIANNAATIRNLTAQGNTTFEDPVTFNQQINIFGFVLKKEQNGSLSLAIGN